MLFYTYRITHPLSKLGGDGCACAVLKPCPKLPTLRARVDPPCLGVRVRTYKRNPGRPYACAVRTTVTVHPVGRWQVMAEPWSRQFLQALPATVLGALGTLGSEFLREWETQDMRVTLFKLLLLWLVLSLLGIQLAWGFYGNTVTGLYHRPGEAPYEPPWPGLYPLPPPSCITCFSCVRVDCHWSLRSLVVSRLTPPYHFTPESPPVHHHVVTVSQKPLPDNRNSP